MCDSQHSASVDAEASMWTRVSVERGTEAVACFGVQEATSAEHLPKGELETVVFEMRA